MRVFGLAFAKTHSKLMKVVVPKVILKSKISTFVLHLVLSRVCLLSPVAKSQLRFSSSTSNINKFLATAMADRSAQSISDAASRAGSSASGTTSSLWDRFSDWASDHKAVVYTVAGVTLVVTGAGIYYYTLGSGTSKETDSQKKSKKERRKAKKEADEASQRKDATIQGNATCHDKSDISDVR